MSARHSSPPPTSAAVLEFICLFTHDLKRKQKRWQDGRLKYHTFNKRVMVYDDRGNFVGDMHWRHDWELDEGEEVQLERGGVIVQVQELSSRREQDLSELLDKRAKEKETRQMQAVSRSPVPNALPRPPVRPVVTRSVVPPLRLQQHRPLHQVIGTPTGHHGRATVSKESPFQQRQQATESPDERAAKRRKHNEPPPSKSGYASALFGQALTLSATPMSSLPIASRRTIRQRDPSPEVEETTMPAVREEPQPPLREQTKTSQHFNQAVGQARSFGAAKNVALGRRKMQDDDEPPTTRKQECNLPKKQPVLPKNKTNANDDDEVIEIDDPDAALMDETVRPERANKKAAKPPKVRNKAIAKLTDALANKPLERSICDGDDTEDAPDEELNEVQTVSKKQELPANLQKSRAKIKKPAEKKATARATAPISIEEPRLEALIRDPKDPVTELRLKSRKKRGLLMMSEMTKQPCGQRYDDLGAPLTAVGSSEAKKFEETGYPFRSPSPTPQPTIETPTTRSANDYTAQRRVSDELGKEADPFRVSSPEPPAEGLVVVVVDRAVQKQSGDIAIPDDEFGAVSQVNSFLIAKKSMQDAMSTFNSRSNPHRKVYDPYRIPSSSPEDLSELPVQLAARPDPEASSTELQGRAEIHSEDERQVEDDGKKAKKPRLLRRNMLLAEDDELNANYGAADQAKTGAVDLVEISSDANIPAPKEQVERNKATKGKSKAQENSGGDEAFSDLGHLTSKRQTKPKKTRENAKKKSKALEEEHEPESEDEQPVKRRRAARRTRGRVAEPAECPLPSEQEASEEEPRAKRSRKTAPKVSEDRPRLVRIKKGVRSREIVGFDLSAMNAPLGFRGIGVPFSILPSPVNESIQRRADNHAAVELSSDSVLEDLNGRMPVPASDGLQSVVEADKMALNKPSSPAVGRESGSFKPVTTCAEPLVMPLGDTDDSRSQTSGKTSTPSLPGLSSESKDNRYLEDIMSKQTREVTARSEQATASETELPQKGSAPLDMPKLSPRNESQPVEATARPAVVEMPRPEEPQNSSKAVASGGNRPAKKTDSTTPISQQEITAVAPGPVLRTEPSECVADGPTDAASTLSKAPVAKPFTPPTQTSIPAVQHQETTAVSINHQNKIPDHTELETITEIRSLTALVLPAFKKPEPKATPVLRPQHSSTGSVAMNDGEHSDIDVEEMTAVTAAVIPALPAFKRPEQKTTPVVQRELPRTAHFTTMDEQDKNGGDPRIVEDDVAENSPQDVEATAPKAAPVLRRQPPSFKPPTKATTSKAPKDTANSPVNATSQIQINEKSSEATRVRSRHPSNNTDVDTGEIETAKLNLGVSESIKAKGPAAPIQEQNPRTLKRTTSVIRRINNIAAEPPAPTGDTASAETSAKTATGARITNPASRGRKAAVRSDAKGPVPQRMLPPTQPFAFGPLSTADFALTPIEEPPKEPERPKKKMTFPGFQSARDEGPWSREAYDLLESGRPG
ncbi:unnamed protein product [Discula destructiva]